MTSTVPHDQILNYVQTDVPEGQTLREWRRELERARRERRRRSTAGLRFPRLRTAW